MTELADWWHVIVGLIGGVGAYFGWMKIREGKLVTLAKTQAEDRESQRKETEELREEVKNLRHQARDDQHTYGLQYKYLTERLENADLRMKELRRDHEDELRERDARIAQWQEQADAAQRQAATAKRDADAASTQVTILQRQVAELTAELNRYRNTTPPGAQG